MPEGAHPLGRERGSRPRAAVPLLGELSGLVAFAPFAAGLFAALLGAGCDAGTQHNASQDVGPSLHVVGFNGESADAGPRVLPPDGYIQIAFDRLLHPASVTRQSFSLKEAAGIFLEPIVTYDPVARVVTVQNPSPSGPGVWLKPGVTYSVTMGVAAAGDYLGGSGPRAIDGATLAAPAVVSFQAGPAPATPTSAPDAVVSFCNDVLPIFQLRCSGGLCHGSPAGTANPAEGLILQTPEGIANTAIGGTPPRVAQESNTGALAASAVQGKVFGVDMAIIDPGNPGGSWLMYKVLRGQVRPVDAKVDAGGGTCGTATPTSPVLLAPSPQPQASLLLSIEEEEILSQYILGNQMPYPLNLPKDEATPDFDSDTLPLTFSELERVRAWIAQGANVTACTACP